MRGQGDAKDENPVEITEFAAKKPWHHKYSGLIYEGPEGRVIKTAIKDEQPKKQE